VTGRTASTNFPIANALQPAYGGGSYDAFVARIRADGSSLIYSTYLGGSGNDLGLGIAVDPATGDAIVTGQTTSTNFPTANAWQPNIGGGANAFVTRLKSDGSSLVWSTYLGGEAGDEGFGVAVDPATGEVLIAGYTQSNNFPTTNYFGPPGVG